jgi:YD repeat-containing protein
VPHIRKTIAAVLAGLAITAMPSAHAAAAPPKDISAVPGNASQTLVSDLQVVDAQVASQGFPFSITRLYHWDPAATPGLLGKSWRLSLEARLEVSAATVVLDDADGTKVTFTRQSDGTYSTPEGAAYKLTATGGGYSLASDSGTEVRNFDQTGRLSTVVNGSGTGLQLTYTTTGRIAAVADAEGRVARFTTSSTGLLLTVTLADGGRLTYVYSNDGYLTRVANVVGKVTTYSYDSQGRLITN